MVAQNKAQHSPGPWRFRFIQLEGSVHASAMLLETSAPNRPANDPCILAVREDWVGWLRHTEIGQADARLIEAAPELLEALKLAESALDCYRVTGAFAPGQPSGWLLRTIRAAIARATGTPTAQGTAAAVAEALGRSPAEPGTARLVADLEGGAK